ncbi:MAG: hypothetical protein AUG12_00895 [Acidobacteria bacterium 13_1_20CM_2_57_8]|nr:MAG: hypothetical protein AUG12_00895 [Acidobacteria bacterium 13_1_20CM_2_57_8]
MDEVVEKIVGHLGMDGMMIVSASKLRDGMFPRDEGKRGDTGHRICFQVIAAEKDNYVGFRFVQNFSQFTHGRDAGIQHFRFFIGRPENQLWSVNRSECCDNFTHSRTPYY